MEPDKQADTNISARRRRWSMRVAAVLLALTPFALLEAGLRWFDSPAGEAVDTDPLVNLDQLRPLFVLDEAAGRWKIPQSRLSFFRPDSFLADKPVGLKRIFVLGGSTVQGRPFAIETAFSTWLRLRLEAASPETRFEVVNCGGVSYASYRVARILDEVLQHQPDAIVLYTGHNEFLEERSYANLRQYGPLRRRFSRAAGNLATVNWLRRQFQDSPNARTVLASEVDARLDHVGGLERYHRDPAWRSGIETHFAESLQRMADSCQRAAVPIVLCLPASDLVNTPPFKSETKPGLTEHQKETFDAAWAIARDVEAGTSQRLAACAGCLAIDAEHAGANYVAGRLLYHQGGNPAKAIEHLTVARDHDVCPLRATTPIVAAVRQVAEENGVSLIDTIALWDQRDCEGNRIADSIADPEMFVDHVHPTIGGHQQLGAALETQLEKLGWFQPVSDSQQRYQSLSAAHLDTLGEEYYARGKQRLEGLQRWASGRVGQLDLPEPSEQPGEK